MFPFYKFREIFCKNLSGLILDYQAKYPDLPNQHVKILVKEFSREFVELFRETNNNYIYHTYIEVLTLLSGTIEEKCSKKFKQFQEHFMGDALLVIRLKKDLEESTIAFSEEKTSSYCRFIKELIQERSQAILPCLYDYLIQIPAFVDAGLPTPPVSSKDSMEQEPVIEEVSSVTLSF